MKSNTAILILTPGPLPGPDLADPLLSLVDGQDMLTSVTQTACATGCHVFVTIATGAMPRAKAIANEPVTIVPVATHQTQMSAAIVAGMKSLPKGLSGVLIMFGNMGQVTVDDLTNLLTHFAETGAARIISATDETGHPGHPLVIPARLFKKAAALTGELTARSLMQNEQFSLVRLADGHANTDIERPANWIRWRAGP